MNSEEKEKGGGSAGSIEKEVVSAAAQPLVSLDLGGLVASFAGSKKLDAICSFLTDAAGAPAKAKMELLEKQRSACSKQWSSATRLPLPEEFFEAWLCLKGNAFIDAVMEGGLAIETRDSPGSWMGADLVEGESLTLPDYHSVWIALADGTGGQIGLWNENWEDPSSEALLRVVFFDSEGDTRALAPDFPSFLRSIAVLSLEPFCYMSDMSRCVGYIGARGELFEQLEGEELRDEPEELERVKAGKQEFLRFLADVWGVTTPIDKAEVETWQEGLNKTSKAVEAFVDKFRG